MPTKDGKGSCIPLLLLLSCGKRKRPCVLLGTHPHGFINESTHTSIHPPHHTTPQPRTLQNTTGGTLPTDTITLLIKPSVCKTGSCLHGRKRGARPPRPTLFLRACCCDPTWKGLTQDPRICASTPLSPCLRCGVCNADDDAGCAHCFPATHLSSGRLKPGRDWEGIVIFFRGGRKTQADGTCRPPGWLACLLVHSGILSVTFLRVCDRAGRRSADGGPGWGGGIG